jgi:two-component system sensor histidine kinase TctE
MAQTDRALRAPDFETVRPALQQVQNSTRRTTRLVNQLLTLARAEPAGEPGRGTEPLDLSRLVQETCAEWVPEAITRGVDLGFSGDPGPTMIDGDELLLREMLGNLIDNAIRYGGTPGIVTVRLEASPTIRLSVEDDGAGIPESEFGKIFERFHRVPGSPPGGSGLGLAIVREIARVHGADVSVQHAGPKGGAIFRIIFAVNNSSPPPA